MRRLLIISMILLPAAALGCKTPNLQDRMNDASQIVRLNLGVGPGLLVNVQATRALGLGVGMYEARRFGFRNGYGWIWDERRYDMNLVVPVWGWGPNLGPGHLTPREAARAVALLRPRYAVPVHWGTLFPVGLRRFTPGHLSHPPLAFEQGHLAERIHAPPRRQLKRGVGAEVRGQVVARPGLHLGQRQRVNVLHLLGARPAMMLVTRDLAAISQQNCLPDVEPMRPALVLEEELIGAGPQPRPVHRPGFGSPLGQGQIVRGPRADFLPR